MSGGRFDFREVKKLQKQLQAIEKGKDAFYRECAQELAERLLAKVVRRTPVGQTPKIDGPKTVKVKGESGKSKSLLSKKGAILERYWSGYQGGILRRSWTVGEINRNGENYEIEISNPVQYASYVEYGHRQTPGQYIPALGKRAKKAWVPGKFMMTISEKELQKMTPKLLEKKLEVYLRRCLDGE